MGLWTSATSAADAPPGPGLGEKSGTPAAKWASVKDLKSWASWLLRATGGSTKQGVETKKHKWMQRLWSCLMRVNSTVSLGDVTLQRDGPRTQFTKKH